VTWTVGAAVRALAARIAARPDADGQREARLLVDHVTGLSPSDQFRLADTSLSAEHAMRLEALVARREAGEPLARLTGRAFFWDFEVRVSAETLIPRDDTGTLVEAALAALPSDRPVRVADLGTGTGIVLLALARERPMLSGIGTDISADALATARRNAEALGLQDRLDFVETSWLADVDGAFDIIVSNPPYVTQSDLEGLAAEVRLHDPVRALVGGADGLDAYRGLVPQAAAKLTPGGVLLVEIGADQAATVPPIGLAAGLSSSELRRDLRGQPRVVSWRRT
jgi:release factor glutamine methyltransferase